MWYNNAMSWEEIKDEKEGYVRVRKSEDRALVGRLRKANDDAEAKGYIELKVDDLGFEGGGGPHTHNNYALTGHTHDDYLTDLPDHSHPEYEGAGGSYDDTELVKRIEDDEVVIEDHEKRIKEEESASSKNRQKIDNLQNSINDINNNKLPGKADVDHTHDNLGGGVDYDDTEVRDLIQGNTDAIAEIQTKGYDDTALAARVFTNENEIDVLQGNEADQNVSIQANTDALAGKADADHTHDVDEVTPFDPTYLEEKDAEEDARLDALEESQEEQNTRLDALEEGMGGDDCILGRYIRNDFFYHNGGAQAQDYYLKLHKPTDNYGDDSNQGDLDNRDIDKNMSGIEIGDTVWLIVGDNVHEIVLDAKQDMSHYYGYRFNTRVESLIPKDAEFLLQSAETCGEEEVAEHEHEGMVVSDSVASIVKISQADFDALADKDASTLYLVV